MLRSTEISSDTLLVSSVAGDGGRVLSATSIWVGNTFYLLDQLEKLECAKAAYLLLPLIINYLWLPFLTIPYISLPFLTFLYLSYPFLTFPYLYLPFLTFPNLFLNLLTN